jgi:hypothetical protein
MTALEHGIFGRHLIDCCNTQVFIILGITVEAPGITCTITMPKIAFLAPIDRQKISSGIISVRQKDKRSNAKIGSRAHWVVLYHFPLISASYPGLTFFLSW